MIQGKWDSVQDREKLKTAGIFYTRNPFILLRQTHLFIPELNLLSFLRSGLETFVLKAPE